jgi:hypothetical protein
MPRLFLILAAAFAFFLPAPTAAQDAPVAPLNWLAGEWTGGGTHGGRPSKASFAARPALGGRFVELTYRLESPFAFEGRAFYRPVEGGGWKAEWYDSRGLVLPVSATLRGSALTADWGTVGTEQGRTIYRLLADGRLEIVDFVLRPDGTRVEFARQTFVKGRPSQP